MEEIADIRLVETQKDKFLKGVKPNKSYHDAQLQTLLTSFMSNPAVSCSTRARRLNHIRTIFYVLTAMFTGFRVQTLGQLKRDSFEFSAKVHTLTVPNLLVTAEDGREYTTNKTDLSLRLPIVRQFESLHLKEFVSLKVHGDGPIFGPATVTLDQRVDAQLVAAGLKQPRQRMHSLRGTANNKYLLCSAVQPDMKEILMGHVDQTVSGAYNDFTFLMESKPEAIRGLMEKALVYEVDFTQIGNYLKKQMEWFSL